MSLILACIDPRAPNVFVDVPILSCAVPIENWANEIQDDRIFYPSSPGKITDAELQYEPFSPARIQTVGSQWYIQRRLYRRAIQYPLLIPTASATFSEFGGDVKRYGELRPTRETQIGVLPTECLPCFSGIWAD